MDCTSCGKTLTPGSGFCTACGAAVKDAAPVDLPAPVTDTPAAPAGRREHGRALLLTVVAVIVLVGGGITAFALLTAAGSDPGGAETPEGLVAAFEEAAATNDLAGMVALLPPDERRPLARLFNALVDRGRAEGLLPDEGSPLDGVTVAFDRLDPDIDEIDEGLARIELGEFDLSLTFDEPFLRLAARAGHQLQDVDVEVPAGWERYDWQADETTEVDGFVMAVRRDGRWYLSGLYTIAQTLVEAYDLDEVDMSTSPEQPPAADTPEEALIEYIEAAGDLDVDTLIAGIGPATEVLPAYGDTLGELEERFEESLGENRLRGIEVGELDVTTTDLGGGLVDVAIEDLELVVEMEEWQATIRFDGECFDYEQTFRERDNYVTESCIPDPFLRHSGIRAWSVRMRQAGGGYVLDPLETMAATLETMIVNADRSVLLRALGLSGLAPEASTVPFGEVIEVRTSPAGTWVATLEANEGDLISVNVEDGYWGRYQLIDPDGGLAEFAGGTVWRVTTSGTHRLVLEDYEEWDARDLRLRIDAVEVVDHPADQDIEVTLAPGEVRGFRVEPPEGGLRFANPDDPSREPVLDRSASDTLCGSEVADPCTEPVTIYIAGDLDQETTHRIELFQPPASTVRLQDADETLLSPGTHAISLANGRSMLITIDETLLVSDGTLLDGPTTLLFERPGAADTSVQVTFPLDRLVRLRDAGGSDLITEEVVSLHGFFRDNSSLELSNVVTEGLSIADEYFSLSTPTSGEFEAPDGDSHQGVPLWYAGLLPEGNNELYWTLVPGLDQEIWYGRHDAVGGFAIFIEGSPGSLGDDRVLAEQVLAGLEFR